MDEQDEYPDFKPPVADLFELANTSFDPPTFRRACERFAWFDDHDSDEIASFFSIEGSLSPLVVVTSRDFDAFAHALLEFFAWETFLEELHDSHESCQADRYIEARDLVVWYTFGQTHIHRIEDWPVMPVSSVGFLIRPDGFFDRNPAMDLPAPVSPSQSH
jgi:hypothetical protein